MKLELPLLPEALRMPGQTISGRGCAVRLPSLCKPFGRRGLVVHGASLAGHESGAAVLAAVAENSDIARWQHPGGEPTLDHLDSLLACCREMGVEWIAGVGGGSVLDLAKACAGLANERGSTVEYHDGMALQAMQTLPFIAVPCTAGAGSEVTSVCVLTNAATGVKKSFRQPAFMAKLVLLDASLIESCPSSVMAASGMDAFVQAVESWFSIHATGVTRMWSGCSARLIKQSLPVMVDSPCAIASEQLQTGAWLAGLALSHSRLGLVHGLAHPLGARYHVPHGLVCASCLPAVLAYNHEAVPELFMEFNSLLGADVETLVMDWLNVFSIVNPFAYPIPADDRSSIIDEVMASGSTAANPRPVTRDAVAGLLTQLTGMPS